MRLFFCLLYVLVILFLAGCKQVVTPSFQGVSVTLNSADNNDGTYTNPIIQADYSDPDVIRVGNDYFMTASSFNCAPGLPILHSKDLVNWQLITYACDAVYPIEHYSKVQHGNGIWAPSLRYHNGTFYIFYGDPDFGIFMLKAKEAMGPWSKPLLIKEAKGWIDPCPFWDEDGKAYLVHAYAGSRAGLKSVLAINRMNDEGTELLDDGILVFDGHKHHKTIEGPKLYKRDGYYYIFAPAGGVAEGWQTVLRSKYIYGPYEDKIVLQQGETDVNGPHQGAMVSLANGEDWFMHFQDQEAYGRVVHLQPMHWQDDWPIMGKPTNGCGNPVQMYEKPKVAPAVSSFQVKSMNDEFDSETIPLLWQWHANKSLDWGLCYPGEGVFRMNCQAYPQSYSNLWDVSSLLLQKFPSQVFEVEAKININLINNTERVGFTVMGSEYCCLEVFKAEKQLFLRSCLCVDARSGSNEQYSEPISIDASDILFKLIVKQGALCELQYSLDGVRYTTVIDGFEAKPGRWIGSKFGFYALKGHNLNDSGWLDIDWVRYKTKNE
ncbi:family 43 glycosylhydrolase [Carboxylicivirga sp. N1Y90]|uniref:glycoside hydrolase family 43 protein n=1 Tax=Carboxylicivirga fragile TaxID=3417571 RepID=UPI003D349769|nr:glycoside hydrolase 43 family protein [Marinilabiliaceae bacterium N1Y90]